MNMNLINPSLTTSPLSARQENAIARGVDGVASLMDWAPTARKPATSGFFVTRPELKASAVATRVLFTGGFWMTDQPIAAWRHHAASSPLEKKFRPVSGLLQSKLVETKVAGANAPQKARSFDELALEPIEGDLNPEMASVKKLAELEMKVEVIYFMRPAEGATGVSSGRVLAISENYSAQQVGEQTVVVHGNHTLERAVTPGERVTVAYDGSGKASVYDGLMHDINIDAPWMDRDQNNYMRMVMMDALSMIQDPLNDDERIKAAMQYALESTVNFFGLEQSRLRLAEIELTINEVVGPAFNEPGDATQTSQSPRRPKP